MWRVVRSLDDHFVDLSTFHHTPHYLQAWAYCVLESPGAVEATIALTTNGPAEVWLNREQCRRVDHFHHQLPHTVSFPVQLKQGRNEIGVCFEAVALRECPYVMALQLVDGETAGNFSVFLPTSIRPEERRQKLESVFKKAYLDRDLFSRHAKVVVRWPEGEPAEDDFALPPGAQGRAHLQRTPHQG